MEDLPGGKKMLSTEIFLPGGEWEVLDWKCTEGSLVQHGETVALACPKGMILSVSHSSTDNSSKTHKRPTRRRRITPSGAIPSSSLGGTTLTTNTAVDQFASIQQRLAAKLSSEKQQSDELKGHLEVTPVDSVSVASNPGDSVQNEEIVDTKKGVETKPILAPMTGILRKARNNTQSGSNDSRLIGFIDECSHPAFLDGICVVCGASLSSISGKSDTDEEIRTKVPLPSFQQKTSQLTVSGGITMTVSAEESRQMSLKDTERLLQNAKLSLVLDLDHTLVHATADPRARQFYEKDDVRTLRLPTMEGVQGTLPPGAPPFMQHYVKLRPHINTFLKSVQADYELTVYTAGTRQYAEEITVVLCRHMVGSKNDIDDLERLRYDLHMARIEYQKVKSLGDSVDEDSKRGHDEADTEPHARKRKKVSFGAPSNTDVVGDGNKSDGLGKSDHMTKEKVEALEKELESAEDLERQALALRQKLFGSRVVSRTDVGDLGRDVKSLKRIFPCGGTMAVVIDDREDVWANASDNSQDTIKGEPPANLVLVRPYHWQPFSGFADINNAAGEDLSGGHCDGEDPSVEKDVQLIWTSRILKGLHRRYYRQEMNDRKSVPQLLTEMRHQVLNGVTMVMSGLVPLHKQSLSAGQARPPVVRYAQTLGARVRPQLSEWMARSSELCILD